MTLHEFVDAVQALRTIHRISGTSWFRTEQRNRAVGGVDNSFHRLGLAVDVVMDDDYVFVMHEFVRDARQVGLEAIYEGNHWHLEPLS